MSFCPISASIDEYLSREDREEPARVRCRCQFCGVFYSAQARSLTASWKCCRAPRCLTKQKAQWAENARLEAIRQDHLYGNRQYPTAWVTYVALLNPETWPHRLANRGLVLPAASRRAA